MNINKELFGFIESSPTAYHAVATAADALLAAGFTRLEESQSWSLKRGGGYFVSRNGSSVIAFRLPENDPCGYMITASHCDTPGFKVKENAELQQGGYIRLSCEPYGGAIYSTWTDRPLSVAGRVVVRTENGIQTKLANIKKPCAALPNLAIHMNRTANEGTKLAANVDLQPLFGKTKKGSFYTEIARSAGVKESDIVASDLFIYNPEKGVEWGSYISSPRLDDLQCAFSSLKAFLTADKSESVQVCCIFDNEEVGSTTKQGAAGTFLADTLERIAACLGIDSTRQRSLIAASFMASCDNGHAVHPAHPEVRDENHACRLNGGVVLKYNAAQRYTTDAVSASIFRLICEKAGVPVQMYANRADMPGGGTLGNIANTQVSLNTVDIGLAQLAMHSAFETAGAQDTAHMVAALKALFETAITAERDGSWNIK